MDRPQTLIGTAGFSFPHWRSLFYPPHQPQSSWLQYYSTHFSSVEVNVTFYRPPSLSLLRRWRQQVPEHFRFTLKAYREITHEKRLLHCYDDIQRLWQDVSPLQESLACILFQVPPSLYVDVPRLQTFLTDLLVNRPFDVDIAFEFRHHSWFTPDVFTLLSAAHCTTVLHDISGRGGFSPFLRQGLPDQIIGGGLKRIPVDDWLDTAAFPAFYLRLHGDIDHVIHREYGDRLIKPWATIARRAIERGKPTYIYFSNDPDGRAIRDAQRMQRLLGLTMPTDAAQVQQERREDVRDAQLTLAGKEDVFL